MLKITILRGDICTQDTDAVVNAANNSLLGGGGVDGALHRAAGPGLLEACRELPANVFGERCITGQAISTPGFLLPAKYVVHTVGPIYNKDFPIESENLLLKSYISSMTEAVRLQCRSVAFPALSGGVYGYPLYQSALVAMRVMLGRFGWFVSTDSQRTEPCWKGIEEVRFVLYTDEAFDAFTAALDTCMHGEEGQIPDMGSVGVAQNVPEFAEVERFVRLLCAKMEFHSIFTVDMDILKLIYAPDPRMREDDPYYQDAYDMKLAIQDTLIAFVP